MLRALARAGVAVQSESAPTGALDRAAGYKHLLGLLAVGIDEALRYTDPYRPVLKPGSTDWVFKWGMDCPDALYLGAPVRGDAVYRVRGRRGTVRYLGLQVMAGIETAANVVADELALGADGTFELIVSANERPGNWMPLRADASSLVVRQFFYDWDAEEPARLEIECIERAKLARGAPTPTAEGVARQLVALGEYVDASVTFWGDIHAALRARGVNAFQEPSARTDIGGAEENVTVWGSWELGPDQALLIEVKPPEALYWSVALGNHWWESLDYSNHQSSLNGHQAVIDPDGMLRAVIARSDPGIANWLDPAGFGGGPMIFRYVRADGAPVPATRVVPVGELGDVLPSGTIRVDGGTRAEVIERRRAAVRKRFPR